MSKNQNVIERFFDKVDLDENSGCWNFTSSISQSNCGRFYYNYRPWDAYKIGYILLGGEIPDSYDLHHTCENRLCVNPEHLMAVSKAEHHGDLSPTHIAYKNKHKTHCPQGHPYTEENLVKGNMVGRSCRICAVKRSGDHKKNKRRESFKNGTATPYKRNKFSPEQIDEMKKSNEHHKIIMERYGVSYGYLYSLRNGFVPKTNGYIYLEI